MQISVVIPALNEEACLGATLASVQAQPGATEVILVDGGSTDATQAVAARLARVLISPPGRAVQMNRGAGEASGEVLLFLHADTLLPPDAFAAIRRALEDPEAEAGLFRLRFDRPTPLLRFYAFTTRLPWPRLGFGDRGLFVRRSVFEALGGFPDMAMFEDLEMTQRLHQRGGFRFLPERVTTSARRFHANGTVRQQLRNTRLWLHYVRGTDPRRLTHLYAYDDKSAGR